MEEDRPNKNSIKFVLLGLLCFILGLAVGGGGVYFYSQKFIIPKRENELMSELFKENISQESESQWAEFFEKIASSEEEYTNPFELNTEVTPEPEEQEEYVNPFEGL